MTEDTEAVKETNINEDVNLTAEAAVEARVAMHIIREEITVDQVQKIQEKGHLLKSTS